MMAFEQRSQNNEVYAFMLWFRKGGTLFEFSAMTRPELRTTIEHVPYTLAELDDRDKEKLTIERLELVKSRDNESLEEFNSRISNTLPKEITALINNLSPGQSLPDGKELKVVLKEPYFKD
jgi:predicted Zn-dependent protease